MSKFNKRYELSVTSEIGKLEGVILHTPGLEIEHMTPANAERALYSDVLNLSVASMEYDQLKGVLEKTAQVFQVEDLLAEVLDNSRVRNNLIQKICANSEAHEVYEDLLKMSPSDLSEALMQGVLMKRDNLSRFLSNERYSLRPLHNFFFTRDLSVVINDRVLISKMASQVRSREALIMETIFDYHPMFSVETLDLNHIDNAHIEGGDVLVANENTLIIGCGARTNSVAIDHLIESFKKEGGVQHILVQELPLEPESFIHLDMVFTLLDKHTCMVYKPVVMDSAALKTVSITIDNGKVSIREEKDLLRGMEKLGMEMEPVFCGSTSDTWIQEREQWHSGANFFALGEGKIIGYHRNVNTIEALDYAGFSVIDAVDVIENKVDLDSYDRYVITIDGSELARGGGGCRCMTMPIRRAPVK